MLPRLALATLAAQMGLSAALWWPVNGVRTFPALPVWGNTPAPNWCSFALSSLLLLLLLLRVAGWPKLPSARAQQFDNVLFALLATLCLFDLNRLQVWVWMWLLLLPLGILSGERTVPLRWAMAGLYCWSGFHKINPWFAEDVFSEWAEAFSLTRPLAHVSALGYAAAVLELLFGLGLLWARTRRVAVVGIGLMHLSIVCVLSPWGVNWNAVVIPWNFGALALVVHLFWKKAPKPHLSPLISHLSPLLTLSLLTWLAPALNYVGWWPESMSWKMYANTHPEASLVFGTGSPCSERAGVWTRHVVDERYLVLDDWAFDELGVPAFNCRRNWQLIAEQFCTCPLTGSGHWCWSARLQVLHVHPWRKSDTYFEEVPLKVE